MQRGKVDPGVSELHRGNELSRDHVNRPLVLTAKLEAWYSRTATAEKLLCYDLKVRSSRV